MSTVETIHGSKLTRLLSETRDLLDRGRPEEALARLTQSGQAGRAVSNAKGVCLLRTGEPLRAIAIFRELVFPANAFSIPDNTPVEFVTNYVTALFLTDQAMVGRTLLAQIGRPDHPGVRRLKDAVAAWKRTLSWGRRLLLTVGAYPKQLIRIDFPPGDLWDPAGPTRPDDETAKENVQ